MATLRDKAPQNLAYKGFALKQGWRVSRLTKDNATRVDQPMLLSTRGPVRHGSEIKVLR